MVDSGSDLADVDVALRIDEETMAALLREGVLMGDGDPETTIRRRLQTGAVMASIMGPQCLQLRPIHRSAFTLRVILTASIIGDLDKLVREWGYEREVVVATILSNDICKPLEIVERERQAAPAFEREVRREPGKGNIYPVELQMPGYQLVFVRMLAKQFEDRALVIEEALLALARKIVRGDPVLGAPVSAEALSFAQRMVGFAPRDGNARARAW